MIWFILCILSFCNNQAFASFKVPNSILCSLDYETPTSAQADFVDAIGPFVQSDVALLLAYSQRREIAPLVLEWFSNPRNRGVKQVGLGRTEGRYLPELIKARNKVRVAAETVLLYSMSDDRSFTLEADPRALAVLERFGSDKRSMIERARLTFLGIRTQRSLDRIPREIPANVGEQNEPLSLALQTSPVAGLEEPVAEPVDESVATDPIGDGSDGAQSRQVRQSVNIVNTMRANTYVAHLPEPLPMRSELYHNIRSSLKSYIGELEALGWTRLANDSRRPNQYRASELINRDLLVLYGTPHNYELDPISGSSPGEFFDYAVYRGTPDSMIEGKSKTFYLRIKEFESDIPMRVIPLNQDLELTTEIGIWLAPQ